MKSLFSYASVFGAKIAVLLVILFVGIVILANGSFSLRPHQFILQEQGGGGGGVGSNIGDNSPTSSPKEEIRANGLGMEMYPTGSSLPDCSHACGSCFPCKRVIVSFKCAVESCPIVYRCMCKGKYYHVPSN